MVLLCVIVSRVLFDVCIIFVYAGACTVVLRNVAGSYDRYDVRGVVDGVGVDVVGGVTCIDVFSVARYFVRGDVVVEILV